MNSQTSSVSDRPESRTLFSLWNIVAFTAIVGSGLLTSVLAFTGGNQQVSNVALVISQVALVMFMVGISSKGQPQR